MNTFFFSLERHRGKRSTYPETAIRATHQGIPDGAQHHSGAESEAGARSSCEGGR